MGVSRLSDSKVDVINSKVTEVFNKVFNKATNHVSHANHGKLLEQIDHEKLVAESLKNSDDTIPLYEIIMRLSSITNDGLVKMPYCLRRSFYNILPTSESMKQLYSAMFRRSKDSNDSQSNCPNDCLEHKQTFSYHDVTEFSLQFLNISSVVQLGSNKSSSLIRGDSLGTIFKYLRKTLAKAIDKRQVFKEIQNDANLTLNMSKLQLRNLE